MSIAFGARPRAGKSRWGPILAALVVCVGVGGWYLFDRISTRSVEINADVSMIDYAARTMELEVSLTVCGVSGAESIEIPVDCTMTVDGKPASINDIAVGDKVLVSGEMENRKLPDGENTEYLKADSVEVQRNGS